MAEGFRSDLRDRLPHPLALLYVRVLNAKALSDRHNNALFLLESTVKLVAAAQVSVYLRGGARDGSLDQRLSRLALPSLGHWVEIVSCLGPATAGLEPHPFPEVAAVHALLRDDRRELPAVAACLREMSASVVGVPPLAAKRVRAWDLLDRLPAYRNQVLGHGGVRGEEFYDRMSEHLLAAAVEVLERVPLLGRSALCAVGEVRDLPSAARVVELWDLTGSDAILTHLTPGQESRADAPLLPGHVYLRHGSDYLDLHPLVVCSQKGPEQGVCFLNKSLDESRIEYVDYVTGETSRAPHLLADHRRILGRILGIQATEAEVAALQAAPDPDARPSTESPDPGGLRRFGDFDLVATLGEGAMGTVYLARQRSLGRVVALKLMPPALSSDGVAAARFEREVRALARSEHPNVVRIYASGRHEGRHWYAMEFVDGCDLRELGDQMRAEGAGAALTPRRISEAAIRLSEARRQGHPPLPAEATRPQPSDLPARGHTGSYERRLAEIFRAAAHGLQHLHERGVIHRDVKPSNLMLTRDGRAVVMDLGLAQLAGDGSLTSGPAVLGTIRYAAPEQVAQAVTRRRADARADVYGLGATLYEMATGRPPYEAETPEDLVAQVLRSSPPAPRRVRSGMSKDLDAVIQKAMDRDPSRRYASAAALAEDLARFAAGEPVFARPPSLAHLGRLWVRRHAAVATVVAVALLLGLGATVLFLRSLTEERNRARSAEATAEAHAESERRSRERAERLAGDLRQSLESEQQARREADRHLAAAYDLKAGSSRSPVEKALLLARRCDLLDEPEARGALAAAAGLLRAPLWHAPSLPNGARALSWSRDGLRLGAAFLDGAFVWDLATGQPVLRVLEDRGIARAFALSPDGRRAVLATTGGGCAVVDVDTGEVLTRATPGESPACSIAYLPDGRSIALGCLDGTIRIADAATLQVEATWVGHRGPVLVVVQPDSPYLASSADDGVRLWEIARGRPVESLSDRVSTRNLALSRRGALLAVARMLDRRRGTSDVIVRRTAPVQEVKTLEVPGEVASLAFGDGPERLFVWTEEGVCSTWIVGDWTQGPPGPSMTDSPIGAVAFHPDGRSLAVATGGGTLATWEVAAARPTRQLEGLPHELIASLDFDPDGARLLSGTLAHVWDARTGDGVRLPSPREVVLFPAFSPDGTRIAGAATSQRLFEIDARTASVLAEAETGAETLIRRVAYLPGGGTLAGLLGNGRIVAWDRATGSLRDLVSHPSIVRDFRVTADGQRLLVATDDGLELRDATNGTLHTRLSDVITPTSIACSPSGERYAAARRVVQVIEAGRLGRELRPEDEEAGEIRSLAFTPDGTGVLGGFPDGTARLWASLDDPEHDPSEVVVAAHPAEVTALAVSRSGAYVASASRRGTLQVDDLINPRNRARLQQAWAGAEALALHPDGRRMLVGADGRLLLFDPRTSEVLEQQDGHLIPDVAICCPQGDVYATGEGTRITVRRVDWGTGVATLEAPGSLLGAHLAFSPDGGVLVCALETGQVTAWRWRDATTLLQTSAPQAPVHGLCVTADGRRVVVCSGLNGRLAIWEAFRPEPLPLVAGLDRPLWRSETVAMAISHDGRVLVATDPGGGVVRWDLDRGSRTRYGPEDEVATTVAVTPDGSRIAWGGNRLRVADADGTRTLEGTGHTPSDVVALAFDPNGARLAYWDGRGTLGVCEMGGVPTVTTTQAEPGDPGATLAFRTGQAAVLTCSRDGGLCLWEPTAHSRLLYRHRRDADFAFDTICFPPRGGTFVQFRRGWEPPGEDKVYAGQASAWDLDRGMRWKEIVLPPNVRHVALVAEDTLAAVEADDAVRLWSLADGQVVRTLPEPPPKVTALAASPQGGWLAAGGADGNVHMWASSRETAPTTMRAGAGDVVSLRFDPEGRLLAAGTTAGALLLYDVAPGTLHASLPGHQDRVEALAFDPTGRWLLSWDLNGELRAWDIARRAEVARIRTGSLATDPRIEVSGDLSRVLLLEQGGPRLLDLTAVTWPAGKCLEQAQALTGLRLHGYEIGPEFRNRLLPPAPWR